MIMADFQKMKFKDLLKEKIIVGIKKGNDYSFIPMENVDSGAKYPRIIETKKFNGSGSKFANGDTLFARITPCLQNKKIIKVKDLKDGIGFGSTEFFVFRAKKGLVDPDYLYYTSKLNHLISTAISSMVGASGRQRADIKSIHEYELSVPPLPAQTRISSILSAYDDLIENNEKRIKLLEEMAQRLYTEWFVKFRFPGHKKLKMVDSGTKYGMLPEGWEVRNVESLIKRVTVGKKYENKSVFEIGKVPVLDQGKSGFIGYHNDEPGVNASVDSPVIVFANHTCYQNIIVYPFSAIQNVLPFISRDERNVFWLHWATKDLVRFNDYKGHWPEFMSKKLVVPSIQTTQRFGGLVCEIVALKHKLELENKTLSKTRDLLIPNLVVGKRIVK